MLDTAVPHTRQTVRRRSRRTRRRSHSPRASPRTFRFGRNDALRVGITFIYFVGITSKPLTTLSHI